MKKTINFNVDKAIYNEAIQVLEGIGLSVDSAINMLFTRIVREQSIMFLLSDSPISERQVLRAFEGSRKNLEHVSRYESPFRELSRRSTVNMTKTKAINLFRREDYYEANNSNTTYASRNQSVYKYWANPNFNLLDIDWFLILNDWERKELHLFEIPKNSIKASDMVARNDREELIDLQITYNDSSFTDERSGMSFARFWVKSIEY